jgi:predicted deacylase
VVHGARPGPTTLLITGLHGTELMAQDLLRGVFTGCKPAAVRGRLIVVFCLDILGASAGVPAHNPRDGKNPNRVWPGDPAGTYTERLVSPVFTELVSVSDTVIDLHGGEWNEEVVPFAIVPQGGDADLDRRSVGLARAAGIPLIETAEASGAWLGQGTLVAQSCRSGRCSLAVEVGGGGRRSGRDRTAGAEILRRMLAELGHVEPPGTPADRSTVLAGSTTIRAPGRGVLVSLVRLGQLVSAGDAVADLQSFGGRRLERVHCEVAGVVMLRSLARVVDAGALITKIGVS